jgi:hypothetical protein
MNMSEIYLRVFSNKSELVLGHGRTEIFVEGIMNQSTKQRYKNIVQQLSNGYLENQIIFCRNQASQIDFRLLNDTHINTLQQLIESITSEVGRAIVGLTILQLCVKAIEPNQSIRLHKGSSNKSSFSWENGISMRSLDKQYITPVLRKYNLLKLNADGFMMTRSLAENYPYSPVYKANIRGARLEWLKIVELVESHELSAKISLQYLLSQLLNKAQEFTDLVTKTINNLNNLVNTSGILTKSFVMTIISRHVNESYYPSRIMEIAMHSLMQAIYEGNIFPDRVLKPLSQMRSANKKHGNIGDVEILQSKEIIESWDSKFGKTYLREELEELVDKLEAHSSVEIVGFIIGAHTHIIEGTRFVL